MYSVKPPSLPESFLALAAHPTVAARDICDLLIRDSLVISRSQVAAVVLDPLIFHSENASSFNNVDSVPFAGIEEAWNSSRNWNNSTRELADDWLAAMIDRKDMPYVLMGTEPHESLLSERIILDRIADSRSSLWLPLLDEKTPIGWIGLGVNRDEGYDRAITESLGGLLIAASLALGRSLLRQHARNKGLEIDLVGTSERFLKLEAELKQAARQNRYPILIRGERGTGKELASYAIHYFSKRRDGPFLPVLTSAFAESLQIDELFGHQKGSFTGATTFRKGKFLSADGGTLLLDEVGDLSPTLQVALLRVIEQGEIQSIGQDLPTRVDVRIIAVTNRNLENLVAQGRFRDDLYDRLNVISIEIPPLRERSDDIPLLASYFLLKQCSETNRRNTLNQLPVCKRCDSQMKVGCATQDFYRMLKAYAWPGNVRELKNAIIRLSTISPDEFLTVEHLPKYVLDGAQTQQTRTNSYGSDLTLNAVIRAHIQRVLEAAENNQTEAAKILGIARTTLQAKMKKLRIDNGPQAH
jgi:DNA-binding NtrC family response regulator